MERTHAARKRTLARGASSLLRCAAAGAADPQSSDDHDHTGRQDYIGPSYKFRRQ
jgi:hypothetical protein